MEPENKPKRFSGGYYSFSELNKMRAESASIIEKIKEEMTFQGLHRDKSCVNKDLRTT
jgi:hypothetical protein